MHEAGCCHPVVPQLLTAQSDYRTFTSGDWSAPGTWEVFNGSTWDPAVTPPSSTDGAITIRNTHTIDVNSSLTIDQAVIEGGGIVRFYSGTLTVENGAGVDLVINGALEWWAGLAGNMDVQSGAEVGGSSDFSFGGTTLTNNGSFTGGTLGFFGGASGQNLNGTGTIRSMLMFNASGVTLGGDQTIVDLLNFNYGRIITGSNKIIISSVGNIQNNANPPMYIDGNLQINFPAGGFGLTYHIGDASGYRPMQLSVSGNAGVGGFTVSTSNTEHPNLATSNIDPTKTVNRHWTITNNGSTFTTAFALFNWEAADVDGGANTGNFIGAKYDGASWTYPSIIGSSATSIWLSGLTSFSSFAVGEAFPPPTIDVTGTFGPFCSDDAISIPFIATGTYNTGNIFTAYLSDANGSFASQTYLGELETEASGTINGTIPSAISGTGFRIKIISSDPAVTSADNGSDITISIPLDYYTDNDEDGYGAGPLIISSCVVQGGLAANADDCNDNDNSIYPGVTEICNEIDDDCNGLTDDGLTFVTYYEDLDTDGFGNPLVSQNTCDGPPAGFILDNTDCDDTQLLYLDADSDTYGTGAPIACGVSNNTDCDDNNGAINPAATEVCNNLDDNCNLVTDDGLSFDTYYQDMDGDGFGNPAVSQSTCNGAPIGYVLDNNTDCNDTQIQYLDVDDDNYGGDIPVACGVDNSDDCDDFNDAINPAATEVCNGFDDNCNSLSDDGLTFTTYYQDSDGDGFGDPFFVISTCDGAPMGFITDNSDCNDNMITYVDNDLDGFGVGSPVACGTATVTNDCDDNEPAVNPGAPEVCNGVDDDCNGLTDDGLTFLDYYVDFDGDNFGDQFATPISSCNPVFDYVTNNLDCDDNNAAVYPGTTEVCNDIDDDCNALTDEGLTFVTYYQDFDSDGFGDLNNTAITCDGPPSGFILDNTDCDDTQLLYADADNDTYGAGPPVACGVTSNTDCEPNNSNVHPGAGCGCIVTIPDANFKTALLGNLLINANNNGEIECYEASAYTGSITVNNLSISDLTGIEAFTQISGLNCSNNQLSVVNLINNTLLTFFRCQL
ncbi:MAG: hypothetical protein IPP46_00465 [Bacteroidetes bacterium]|nr:hypothetical protein [Bacteroidota bacterium]